MSDFYCRRSLSWFKLDYFYVSQKTKKKHSFRFSSRATLPTFVAVKGLAARCLVLEWLPYTTNFQQKGELAACRLSSNWKEKMIIITTVNVFYFVK